VDLFIGYQDVFKAMVMHILEEYNYKHASSITSEVVKNHWKASNMGTEIVINL